MPGSTAKRLNFDEIKNAALSAYPGLLERWLPAGKEVGGEYCVGSLHGEPGESLKINIDSGAWKDFAGADSDKGGDPIDLYAAIHRMDNMAEAAAEVAMQLGLDVPPKYQNGTKREPVKSDVAKPAKRTKRPKVRYVPMWKALSLRLCSREQIQPKLDWADQHWEYKDSKGRTLFWVRRKNRRDKDTGEVVTDAKSGKPKKDFFTLAWVELLDRETDEPLNEWKGKKVPGLMSIHLERRRPLYGLDRIAKKEDGPIIWCAGEKAADAAYQLVGKKIPTTTNIGGEKAFEKADWGPLEGRTVIIWADNDTPGKDARTQLTVILEDIGCKVKWLRIDDMPNKADAADLDLTPAEFRKWQKGRVKEADAAIVTAYRIALRGPEEHGQLPDETPLPTEADYGAAPPPDEAGEGGDPNDPLNDPRSPIPLGFDKRNYYYLSPHKGQVIMLSDEQHNEAGMTSLADLFDYWEHSPFVKQRSGVDWKAASAWFRRACVNQGVFDPDVLRGRGAWLDDGRKVVHLGDMLIVDGEFKQIGDHDSAFVYEQARRMKYKPANPLAVDRSRKLLDICKGFNWRRPLDGVLLAGMIVCCHICAVLKWRPSVWITGPSNSGKSTVLHAVIRPLLAGLAIEVQGSSTEAGLRQTIGRDGRPVMFDEAESEGDARDKERMRSILNLVRSSSSEDGADITKGTVSGTAMAFRIRSNFIFASINTQLSAYADESRITKLRLDTAINEGMDEEQVAIRDQTFQDLLDMIGDTITGDYAAALLARSVYMMDVIKDNAETFARAFTLEKRNRRAGDQVGALLAGAYALSSDERVSFDLARKWIHDQDWDEVTVADARKDAERCLQHVIESMIRDTNNRERSVGAIMENACNNTDSAYDDRRHLMQYGVRFLNSPESEKLGAHSEPHFAFAVDHNRIKGLLSTTPWMYNYAERLLEIPGARQLERGVRIAMKGQRYRVVMIPKGTFFDQHAEIYKEPESSLLGEDEED